MHNDRQRAKSIHFAVKLLEYFQMLKFLKYFLPGDLIIIRLDCFPLKIVVSFKAFSSLAIVDLRLK